jgi:cellulose biosynthesis protein BcsQ
LSPSDHGQPQITEKNLYGEIARSEREGAEVILIDLPGVLSRVGLTAMMRAHLVVVPSRDSMMDARDAVSTLTDIDLARQSTGRKIEARALMSAIPASIETKWARAVKEQLAQNGLVVMKVEVILREAFKDMMAVGTHPLRIDLEQYLQKDRRAKRAALEKSAENLAAFADEILGILEATQQSAVEEV